MAETSNSLMRKTKKDLIDIILRKDDVEKRNNEIIRDLKGTITSLENKYNSLNKAYNECSTHSANMTNRITDIITKHKQEIKVLTEDIEDKQVIIESLESKLRDEVKDHWFTKIASIGICIIFSIIIILICSI